MSVQKFPTGNSRTTIPFHDDWLVLDLGSGHNPHVRADVLVDRFPYDRSNLSGRSGRLAAIPSGKSFVIADGRALPFKQNTFDFVICSHVLEHVADVDEICSEITRIGKAGYIETPSKFAELLRHAPYHIWLVSRRGSTLLFESISPEHPLGWLGKAFFSVYFYKGQQLEGKDVFAFAHGSSLLLDPFLRLISKLLRVFWSWGKAVTFTRLVWEGTFAWRVKS